MQLERTRNRGAANILSLRIQVHVQFRFHITDVKYYRFRERKKISWEEISVSVCHDVKWDKYMTCIDLSMMIVLPKVTQSASFNILTH